MAPPSKRFCDTPGQFVQASGPSNVEDDDDDDWGVGDDLLTQQGFLRDMDLAAAKLLAEDNELSVQEIAHVGPVNIKEFSAPFDLRYAESKRSSGAQADQPGGNAHEATRLREAFENRLTEKEFEIQQLKQQLKTREGENKVLRDSKHDLQMQFITYKGEAAVRTQQYEQALSAKEAEKQKELKELEFRLQFQEQEQREMRTQLHRKDLDIERFKNDSQLSQSQYAGGFVHPASSQPLRQPNLRRESDSQQSQMDVDEPLHPKQDDASPSSSPLRINLAPYLVDSEYSVADRLANFSNQLQLRDVDLLTVAPSLVQAKPDASDGQPAVFCATPLESKASMSKDMLSCAVSSTARRCFALIAKYSQLLKDAEGWNSSTSITSAPAKVRRSDIAPLGPPRIPNWRPSMDPAVCFLQSQSLAGAPTVTAPPRTRIKSPKCESKELTVLAKLICTELRTLRQIIPYERQWDSFLILAVEYPWPGSKLEVGKGDPVSAESKNSSCAVVESITYLEILVELLKTGETKQPKFSVSAGHINVMTWVLLLLADTLEKASVEFIQRFKSVVVQKAVCRDTAQLLPQNEGLFVGLLELLFRAVNHEDLVQDNIIGHSCGTDRCLLQSIYEFLLKHPAKAAGNGAGGSDMRRHQFSKLMHVINKLLKARPQQKLISPGCACRLKVLECLTEELMVVVQSAQCKSKNNGLEQLSSTRSARTGRDSGFNSIFFEPFEISPKLPPILCEENLIPFGRLVCSDDANSEVMRAVSKSTLFLKRLLDAIDRDLEPEVHKVLSSTWSIVCQQEDKSDDDGP